MIALGWLLACNPSLRATPFELPPPIQRYDGQNADPDWQPAPISPSYPPGSGPRLAIDSGHHNFLTLQGRYAPLGELARADGFVVSDSDERFTPGLLRSVDLLVVANAVAEDDLDGWTLPALSAFEPDEIDAVDDWVREGGALLLIADQMPMPGAAAALAERFGLGFMDGIAHDAEGDDVFSFSKHAKTLVPQPVSRGIPSVRVFIGQAFWAPAASPLLVLGPGATLWLPTTANQTGPTTPWLPAEGLQMGALLQHDAGRVAAFGEGAMFSAQIKNGQRWGMNAAGAEYNQALLLGVLRWLGR